MADKLGILMLDTKFPRIVGDVGNEQSYSYPIIKKTVHGADPKAVVINADASLLKPFTDAAKELEACGVRAITTSCGFLAMFQKELANAVNVPVFSSALLWANLLDNILPENKIIGILTASSSSLTDKHFISVGISHVKKVVYGMEGTHFSSVFVGNSEILNAEKAEEEMIEVAKNMVNAHPEVGAILFECTNMPPYAKAVEKALGIKVYHIINLADAFML